MMELYVSQDKNKAADQIAARINAKVIRLNGQEVEKLDSLTVVVPNISSIQEGMPIYKQAKKLVEEYGSGVISIDRYEIQRLNWKGHTPITFEIEAETVNINNVTIIQPESEFILDEEEVVQETNVQEAFLCTTYDYNRQIAGYGYCYQLANGEIRSFSGGQKNCNRRHIQAVGFKKLISELVGLKLISNGFVIYTDISSLAKAWSDKGNFEIEEIKKKYGQYISLNQPNKEHEWFARANEKAITIIGHTVESYSELMANDKMNNRFSESQSVKKPETGEKENEEIRNKLNQLAGRQHQVLTSLRSQFERNGGLTMKQYQTLMNWQ